jgi:TPR repeat protein
MYTHSKISLSDIRTMILCEFPLSTEEIGHQYYDGEGVNKSLEEAYVWYQVAQCAGNHKVASLVNYLDSKLTTSKCLKLSSRARHIYTKALQH